MTGPKPAKNQELHTEVTKVIKVFLKISTKEVGIGKSVDPDPHISSMTSF